MIGTARKISLPRPTSESHFSVEQALSARRSVRHFTAESVTLEAISQVLWAAQGVSSPKGRRTAPSAGGLYPLELYLVAGAVTGLAAGVYKYHLPAHTLSLHMPGDLRKGLSDVALWQECVADGAAVVVITAVYERTAGKYGSRAERYVHMEVGHVAENIYLQVPSLGLGTVIVGSFEDADVQTVLKLPADQAPLALLPIGHPE